MYADLTVFDYGTGLEEREETKEVKMRKTNDFITALAGSGDILNTMGGGMTEPRIAFKPSDVGQMLEIRLPGVDLSTLNIEVNFNRLTVFQGVTRGVPRIIFDKPIAYFIDVEKITAMVEGNALNISLPFNERANGYHRRIGIKS